MSLELKLVVDGSPVELLQTPTFVTNMCLTNANNLVVELTGRRAKRALFMYLHWVHSSLDGVYTTPDEIARRNTRAAVVESHEKAMLAIIAGGKKFRLYAG